MKLKLTPGTVVLAVLTIILALGAIYSLELRTGFDTAWMLYIGRLIDQHGFIPYRDIFERNFPGTYTIYMLIGRLINYTDERAFRLVDLTYLAAISAAAWAWLRPLGKRVAWGAVVLFGLAYIGADTSVVGQREYFLILPIVVAALITVRARRWPVYVRAGLVGLLCGLAATVKPHAAIALPALLPLIVRDELQQPLKKLVPVLIQVLTAAFVGMAIPAAAVIVYLVQTGSADEFADILNSTRMYYSRVSKDLSIIEGPDRVWYSISSVLGLNGMLAWLVPAGLGLWFVLRRSPKPASDQAVGSDADDGARQRWHVGQIVMLAACYAVYPAVSGQFFDYHWLICLFFLMALAALSFGDPPETFPRWIVWLPPLAIIAALIIPPDWTPRLIGRVFDHWVAGNPIPTVDGDIADEVAAYLGPRLRPDDRVQVFGSGGAPLHGLLMVDALPATRWLVDTSLHQDVSAPTISAMRREFAHELDASKARYVIDVTQRTFIHGPDTDPHLPEASAVLAEHYQIVYVGHGFSIYERQPAVMTGIVAYPLRPRDVPVLFHPTAAGDVLALGVNRAQNIGSDAVLDEFISKYDVIQAEFLDGGTDAGQNIERALAERVFRTGESFTFATRVVGYVVGDPACQSTHPQKVSFGDAIQLDRLALALIQRGDSSWVCVRLEWSAQSAIPESYKVSLRLIGPGGSVVSQSDSRPAGNTSPTTDWLIGSPVIDQIALPLPRDSAKGTYPVQVVVYNESTLQNLPASGSGADGVLVTLGEIEFH